jgi:uncharacterized protein (TIGR03437 family)
MDGKIGALERGNYAVAFGTGFGEVAGGISTGGIAPSDLRPTVAPVRIFVNGVECPTSFAGLSPGSVGLYQVNFKVPDDLPLAIGYQLIAFQSGRQSQPVSVMGR